MNFDWAELAFGSKKPVNNLKAIFIAAPRLLSSARFTQLVKTYLPHSNIMLGLAQEDYVLGFDGQPQFATLRAATVQPIIHKVNTQKLPHKIYTLSYAQRDTKYVFKTLDFKKIVLVNGSWKYSFHTQAPYYVLVNRQIPYDMISPFASEAEALAYAEDFEKTMQLPHPASLCSQAAMMQAADRAAALSFDYNFQTGVALGKKTKGGYQFLAAGFNKVVPYQTYAMHHGAARERNFSPPHDLNHYDTIHAEVHLMITTQKKGIDLRGTTLFINLLPCPACARMFTQTDIAEFVYRQDHSNGYAIKMLQAAGKKIRRLV